MAAEPGPATDAILKQLASISGRLTAVHAEALARWGTNWLAESLADFNAVFGTATVSPLMEEDEEDDDNVSNASTEIFQPADTGMEVEQTPVAGGNAAPGSAAASSGITNPMDTTVPAPSMSRAGVTEVSIEISPEEPPPEAFAAPQATAPLLTSPDLLPLRVHQAFMDAPGAAPPPVPLVASATVESFAFVEDIGPLESEILVSPLTSCATADLTAGASATDPAASSVAAPTAGGGNAPAADGGGGAVAAAIAGRVAFIAAIANQLPEAGAISLTATSEENVVTSFGSIDLNFLLLVSAFVQHSLAAVHTPSPQSNVWPR